jgi:predicted acetyltransferase
MALEIRPYTQEEAPAVHRQMGIVFGNLRRDPYQPEFDSLQPDWSLCAFEDGQLATTYAAYPFVMRLNGGKAPVAGVTAVGTLPWFRRRGHLRMIMEHDFKRRYEQRMEPIATLLASIAAIYQRYGYAVTSSRYHYIIDPRWINVVPSLPPARGTWREASPDELPLLQSLYRSFARPRNGYIHRAPIVWDLQVLATRDNPGGPDVGPSLLAVYEQDGEPQGYLAYGARWFDANWNGDHAEAGQRLVVRDYVWNTPEAYRAIWEFLKRFDLVSRVHIFNAPIDDPAFNILLDPRELNARRGDWLLSRIIDIERALPLRPYGAEGRITFELRDPMCPWNDGRWALEAGPGGAAVTRTTDSPQLSMDIAALAQLLFGHISASESVRYGRAEAAPNAPMQLWDNIWHTTYAPFCPDSF